MFTGILENNFRDNIRRHVIAFGSLFNNLYVKTVKETRTTTTRVPLSYGAKEKFIQKIISESGITDNTHVQIQLPRMGFEINGLQYDPNRRINKLQKITKSVNGKLLSTYSETPYNFNFNLYVFSRTNEHNLQIIEQVVPYFTPEFTVSMNMNDIFTKVDVPIVLTNVQIGDDYEGDFDQRRSIVSQMNFTMKGYIYGPITQPTIVEDATINFFEDTLDENLGSIGYTGDFESQDTTWSP